MSGTWRERAACRDCIDPGIFFPESSRDYAEARWMRYCGTCPVKVECEQAGRKEFGIWGGKTDAARGRSSRHKYAESKYGRRRPTDVCEEDVERCVRCGGWTAFLVCPSCVPVIADWARSRGYALADSIVPNVIARAWAREQLRGTA